MDEDRDLRAGIRAPGTIRVERLDRVRIPKRINGHHRASHGCIQAALVRLHRVALAHQAAGEIIIRHVRQGHQPAAEWGIHHQALRGGCRWGRFRGWCVALVLGVIVELGEMLLQHIHLRHLDTIGVLHRHKMMKQLPCVRQLPTAGQPHHLVLIPQKHPGYVRSVHGMSDTNNPHPVQQLHGGEVKREPIFQSGL